jgi:acetyl esterase/lipase
VAALPRLSPRVEHWILRLACGLPAPLQRLLAGAPTRLDGQVLAPDIHVLLRLAALAGDRSVIGERNPEEARAKNRADTAAVAGRPLPMARVEALEIPGPAGSLPARLYTPVDAPTGGSTTPEGGRSASRNSSSSLLLYFHGGGWVIGDLDTHDSTCRFLAASTGFPLLSVDYRLAPEHPFPAAVEDATAAFRWAVEHAAELGASAERIAVGGDSAGGNLAAAVSLAARDAGGPAPAMQLLIYPVTDVVGGPSRQLFAEGFQLTKADMDWFEAHYLSGGASGEDPRISVLRAKDLSGLPPAYIATAGFDPLRDEAEAYAERLRATGVRVALKRHPGLIHGFANLTAVSRSSRAAMHEAAGALRMGLC